MPETKSAISSTYQLFCLNSSLKKSNKIKNAAQRESKTVRCLCVHVVSVRVCVCASVCGVCSRWGREHRVFARAAVEC